MRRTLLIFFACAFFAGCAAKQTAVELRPQAGFPGTLAARPMPQGPLLDPALMTLHSSDHRITMYAQATAARTNRETKSITLNFSYVPSAASQVVVASDGSLWALSTAPSGPDKTIWHWNGNAWSNIPGNAQRLAAAPDGTLWAMTSYGGLYHYVSGSWLFAGGPVQDLALDPSGNVYVSIKNSDNQLWQYNAASGWQRINGYGLRLYAQPDSSLYVLIAGGAIYNSASYGAGGYNLCPGNASDLVTIANGAGYYALSYTTNLASGAVVNQYTPATSGDCRTGSYQATNAFGTQIASNGSSLAVLGVDQAIYIATLAPAPSPTPGYTSLYSFQGGTDGGLPQAGLLAVGNDLYGTTSGWIPSGFGTAIIGGGTVFKISASGAESVLHSFGGTGDGQYPEAGLINVNGTLYGTTFYNAPGVCNFFPYPGCGTVFSMSTSGAESVLYTFYRNATDNQGPMGSLIELNGAFYGTTSFGGNGSCPAPLHGCGTVFALTPSSTGYVENIVYSFQGGPDGMEPQAGLTAVNGVLYGTTAGGGDTAAGCTYDGVPGCGTVFSITTAGVKTLLHAFHGLPADGATPGGFGPGGALTAVGSVLYGTTRYGGPFNQGTVFQLTPTSSSPGYSESVLYAFHNPPGDGTNPLSGLIAANGALYGTTSVGGAGQCSLLTYNGANSGKVTGCGTVFKVTLDGTESVLHSFQGHPADGETPVGGLTLVNGLLYGTTYNGGTGKCNVNDTVGNVFAGCGTVFELAP